MQARGREFRSPEPTQKSGAAADLGLQNLVVALRGDPSGRPSRETLRDDMGEGRGDLKSVVGSPQQRNSTGTGGCGDAGVMGQEHTCSVEQTEDT